MEKANAFDESTEKLHFLDYWQVISKRKEVIIATFLLIVFAATVISLLLPATYTARAVIKVESSVKDFNVIREDIARPDQITGEDMATHEQQLMSDRVLLRVISFDVDKTVYLCAEHGNVIPTELGRCPSCGKQLTKSEIPKYDRKPLTQVWGQQEDRQGGMLTTPEALDRLRRGLKVAIRRGTKLIDVSYTSKDKYEAEQIANTLSEVYLQYNDEENKRRFDEARDGLRDAIWGLLHGERDENGELKREGLISLENRLAEKKKEYGLVVDDRTGTLIEWYDFNPLNQKENALLEQIGNEKNRLEAWQVMTPEKRLFAFSNYSAVLNLKDLLNRQKIELSKALQMYGEEHPMVVQLRSLIAELERSLGEEIQGIMANQEIIVQALEHQLAVILKIKEEAEEEYYQAGQRFNDYRRLLDEVNRANLLYQQISQRETVERIKAAIPDVTLQIAQPATVPMYPSGPRRLLNIIIGIVVGLTVGTGLAYFIEYLDTSIKTIDDIERTLGLQILGVIPQKIRLLTQENQNSPAYEAYRILWTNIEFARQESRIKSLLITSGGVAEGKTTTIVNLAIAIANSGLNVLVVDSDFRRPRVHRLLEVSNQTGLTDILTRNADPDGVVARTSVENLWAVPSGKIPGNAVGLLNSRRMKECMDHFADKFDMVLYDSPPVLGLSDSAVMASLVDRVVLCVEYRKYPKSIALRAKKILENIGGKILGAVINNINVLKEDPTYYSQVYHYFQAPQQEEEEGVVVVPGDRKRRGPETGAGTAFDADDDKWE